jgi:transcriptional regulator with XRE-family HTH domain
MNIIELAQRLRQLRVDLDLTLEEVASQAGLTRGWLSKVENFRVTPSLPALSDICTVLGVTLSELFEGLDDHPKLVVVHKSERCLVQPDEDVSQLAYEPLAQGRPSRRMDPFAIKVPKTDDRPQLAHSGEEFLFVIRGTVHLEYGEETHRLSVGDSAYFDGIVPHRLVCTGKSPAEVLVVYHGMSGDEINESREAFIPDVS